MTQYNQNCHPTGIHIRPNSRRVLRTRERSLLPTLLARGRARGAARGGGVRGGLRGGVSLSRSLRVRLRSLQPGRRRGRRGTQCGVLEWQCVADKVAAACFAG